MDQSCTFDVEISAEDVAAFAKLSGDFNPLHTDQAYAATTEYHKPVIHGALLVGLVSRVLGMHIPGNQCLILSMRVRFPKPAFYPTTVSVNGVLKNFNERRSAGTVEVSIEDTRQHCEVLSSEVTFVVRGEAALSVPAQQNAAPTSPATSGKPLLFTGGSGRLGRTLLPLLQPTHPITSLGRTDQAPVPGVTQRVVDLEDAAALADFLANNSPADYYGVVHLSSPPYAGGFVSEDLETTRRHLWHAIEVPLQLARWARQEGSAIRRIILLGSHAGNKHPEPRTGAYSLAKMNMENLVSLLAVDMGTHDATINIICPSSLDVNDTPKSGTATVPTGRVTSPADVANVVEFLLSDESAQINGANIAVDGGLP